MEHKNNILANSHTATIDAFLGINRRVRSGKGEFFDMENLSHEEYPCMQSMKSTKDMEFDLPDGVEAVKMIIPKRLNDEISGFSGVVYNSNTRHYEIYVNGVSKRSDITEFTDAVDYNGSIITLPELKGVNYMAQGSAANDINMYRLTPYISFYNDYTGETADTISPKIYISGSGGSGNGYTYTWYQNVFCANFKVGDEIILYGLDGEFKGNNTIYPQSSTDYTNISSPVSITIKSVSTGGSYSNTTIILTVEIRNSEGNIIGWEKGSGNSYGSDGNTDYTRGTIMRKIPRSTFGCVAHNRIWACSETGEEILASAVGSPLEFYELQGISSDSWIASTGTPGKFTGISAWQNRVVVFKPDIIHIVYGNLPSDFGIEKTYAAGCIDSGSIAEAGGMLIWLYYDGFYAYSGSRPKRISDKLRTKYVSCRAFSDGRRYYARCVKEDGTGEFLIFDTELSLWSKISDIDVVTGDYFGGKVYVCDKTKIYCLQFGEYGDFYAETPELTFDTFDDKSIIYATIRCKISDGFLNLYTRANNGEWVPHKGIDKTGKHKLPIRYAPGDILRLRLEGHGNVCITEIKLDILTK